jgi:hypothetical protein
MTEPLQAESPLPEPDAAGAIPPQTEPKPPQVVRRGGTPLLLTVLLFALLAGGLYVLWTRQEAADGETPAIAEMTQKLQTQGQAENDLAAQVQSETQAVTGQIQSLQARIDKLEKAPPAPAASPAPTPPDTSDIDRRIGEVEARLQALAAAQAAVPAPAPPAPTPPPPDTQAITDLSAKLNQIEAAEKSALDTVAGRIDKLEQGESRVETDAGRTARLARVQQISAALTAGTPIGKLPDLPPALAQFATVAPPTEAGLRESFPEAAAAARKASRPEEAKTSLLDRALARIEQSVVVRRGAHVIVGDPAAGTLDQAESALNSGDLARAVQALSGLQGRAAAAMADWVRQAQSLLDARAALAAMAAHP